MVTWLTMTPGVYLEITAHRHCDQIWKAMWSGPLPDGWAEVKSDPRLLAATGIAPAHHKQLTTRLGGRLVQLTAILNSFQIQMLSVLALEEQYEKPLSRADYERATQLFLEAFVLPHWDLAKELGAELAHLSAPPPVEKAPPRAKSAPPAPAPLPDYVRVLPDVRALLALPFDEVEDATGVSAFRAPGARKNLDRHGQWWLVPFARSLGYTYAFRLAPGPGHGAVLRCTHNHAVTIASSPDRAIFAMLAVERLLVGPKSRARLHDGWKAAQPILRDAVALTGGNPDELEAILHLADDLPKWKSPVPLPEEAARRERLWQMTREPKPPSAQRSIWGRLLDGIAAPNDPEACLRLLQGNHGLDGTHFCGGLSPNADDVRAVLVASAKRVDEAGVPADPVWAPVIDAIAARGEPTPEDFIAAASADPAIGWDALAALGFWHELVGHEVPEAHAPLAEKIAKAAGAEHLCEQRHLIDV